MKSNGKSLRITIPGWQGGLPSWLTGELETKEAKPLAEYQARLEKEAGGIGLSARIARALLHGPKGQPTGKLYKNIGEVLQDQVRVKAARSALYARIGLALGGVGVSGQLGRQGVRGERQRGVIND